ncbi:actinodefensin-associated protein B [Streptomyces sp. NBC_01591]|uniref:actinodefensin-associated protein B n=1 Tax=Streptomyces sp. NBC_01591 TaxID=2975888 RepID=UPI002DDB092B|nr:actinodefensin-associated protein B [Streptomyces sp. NBC_01591]WSD68346.1 actinodefensin-associated protein B [Streptomyces sp. NBC_01591]
MRSNNSMDDGEIPVTEQTGDMRIADHLIFRELPFCGVLLDTKRFTVHRLSQRGSEALRTALHPGTPSPYELILDSNAENTAPLFRQQLIARLTAAGMLHQVTGEHDR